MAVFTLPSYEYVFKIIKDRFTPPKEVTHQIVKDKYHLVKRWDRAAWPTPKNSTIWSLTPVASPMS